jgi:5-methylcytosine-specific restriction endonuclease McrA
MSWKATDVVEYRSLYQGRRWRLLSKQVLLRDGFRCATPGCPNRADTADHVISAWVLFSTDRPWLFWDPGNLVSRCRSCNSRRGAQERNRRYRGVPRGARCAAAGAERAAIAWAERYEADQRRLEAARRPTPRIY